MFLVVVSCVCAALAAAVMILYGRDRHHMMALQDQIDRTNEEKDIVIDFLHKMAEDIGDDMSQERVYRRILRVTALTCGAMGACIYEKTPDGRLRARAVEGLFPAQTRKIGRQDSHESRVHFLEQSMPEEFIEHNEGLIGDVAQTGRGVLIKNAEGDPRVINHNDEALKIKSIMVVPMVFGEHLYGVIAIINSISGKAFSETEFSLAASLGEQAGLYLHNTEAFSALVMKNKLEFDLRLASSVQRYLLPAKLPEIKDLDFAVKYFPQQLIGGDFYDFFNLPDGRLGMVIGDVSGKGISAAILMAICQTKLRYIAQGIKSPAEALKKLNSEMTSSMRIDMFVTMVYAIIDDKSGEITIARAGHEPPLLYKAKDGDAPAQKIKSPGMAVGMVNEELFDSVIEDITVGFEKGDIFVLYTDGVTEAADAEGDEFSTQKLAETVSTLRARNANDLNDEVVKAVEKFSGRSSGYADDFTLATVKKI